MKKLLNISTILMLATFSLSCQNKTTPEVKTVEIETAAAKTTDPNATYAKAEFKIDGMKCAAGCAATIEKKISKMEGVKSAKVDFDKKLAREVYAFDCEVTTYMTSLIIDRSYLTIWLINENGTKI